MAQSTPYTRLSDLFVRSQQRQSDTASVRCGHALSFFAEALYSIDTMSNTERELVMKELTAWMITDKFGPYARPAVHGLHKYCVADCLIEDPAWEASVSGDYFGR